MVSAVVKLLLATLATAASLGEVLANVQPTGRESIKVDNSFAPTTMEIIEARGYKGELFYINSTDGAQLTVTHVINPLADPNTLNRFPVTYYHGITGDASQMISRSDKARPRRPVLGKITMEPSDDNLAFLLLNNNFDVWMMDLRGTNKQNYDDQQKESMKFWDYSIDEEALLDIPSQIQFVLEQTQSTKVHYIGFSMSTFAMFALLSARPHFADNLASYTALAPVAFVGNLGGLTPLMLMPSLQVPDEMSQSMLPQPILDTTSGFFGGLCSSNMHGICDVLSATIVGAGNMVGSEEWWPSFPAKPTSLRVAKHFAQMHLKRYPSMYDFGPKKNMLKYGSAEPPIYDFGKIILPRIILARGAKDLLSDPTDQELLVKALGTKPYLDLKFPTYNHLDFMLLKRANVELYWPLLQAIFKLSVDQSPAGRVIRDPPRPMVRPRTVYAKLIAVTGNAPGSPSIMRAREQNSPAKSLLGSVLPPIQSDLLQNLVDPLKPVPFNNALRMLDSLGAPVHSIANLVQNPLG